MLYTNEQAQNRKMKGRTEKYENQNREWNSKPSTRLSKPNAKANKARKCMLSKTKRVVLDGYTLLETCGVDLPEEVVLYLSKRTCNLCAAKDFYVSYH